MLKHRQRDKGLTIFVFLAPAVVLYGVFFVWPMLQAFYYALFQWRGLSPNKQFVGLANFHRLLFEDPVFWSSLGHNLAFLLVSMVALIPLALFFASALNAKVFGAGTYRAIFLFPNIISIVAVGVLWAFIYDPQQGLLNAALGVVGRNEQTGWLGNAQTALPAVIATSIWYSLGFYIVLFLAGMQSIPKSFYEAASIDGAGAWQSFRHVTVPLMWEILKLGIVYLVIHTLNIFGLVWVMTEGKPSHRTDTMLTYLYRLAFLDSYSGLATALGVIAFGIIFAASMLMMRLMRREVVEY